MNSPSPSPTSVPAPPAIAADTSLGAVNLTVSDLARSRAFYETALGLGVREADDGTLAFGVPGADLVRLRGDASAPALDRRATGLFHLAILFPTRLDLAHALVRLAEARWSLDGVADHLVSEALYLSDPDGNGIELYRDRPRKEWSYADGQLQMATLPLDLRSLADELTAADSPQATAPPRTVMGHVHLQVASIPDAEAFYHRVLGFDVTTRAYPGALFVSAGGYHHHLGLNTWHSAGSGPAATGAVGLRSYEVVLPDQAELRRVVDRIRAAGLSLEAAGDDSATVLDPSGNPVVLVCR
ncbi:MAG TPA: VOC family protein [Solirubrobacteraceae bacterium]|nr:VOC family protein [Solirubrobacteraceae bacterium]